MGPSVRTRRVAFATLATLLVAVAIDGAVNVKASLKDTPVQEIFVKDRGSVWLFCNDEVDPNATVVWFKRASSRDDWSLLATQPNITVTSVEQYYYCMVQYSNSRSTDAKSSTVLVRGDSSSGSSGGWISAIVVLTFGCSILGLILVWTYVSRSRSKRKVVSAEDGATSNNVGDGYVDGTSLVKESDPDYLIPIADPPQRPDSEYMEIEDRQRSSVGHTTSTYETPQSRNCAPIYANVASLQRSGR